MIFLYSPGIHLLNNLNILYFLLSMHIFLSHKPGNNCSPHSADFFQPHTPCSPSRRICRFRHHIFCKRLCDTIDPETLQTQVRQLYMLHIYTDILLVHRARRRKLSLLYLLLDNIYMKPPMFVCYNSHR
jgi:hypothetical protein